MKSVLLRPLSVLVLAGVVACAQAPSPAVSPAPDAAPMTAERQAALTPDTALARLQAGNERFVTGRMVSRDLGAQVRATAEGQFPMASILSCIDSRSAPELVFDQGIGDLFSVRLAANVLDEGVIGSLEFTTRAAGAKVVVVLGHTSCGAIKGACDNVTLGNLTPLLTRLRRVVDTVPHEGDRSSKNHAFVDLVAEANVRDVVNGLRAASPIIAEMERNGDVRIVGAMLDVSTGRVRILPPLS